MDLTHDEFKLPIWFTEIGLNRLEPNHVNVVTGQLEGCIKYGKQNPKKLIRTPHVSICRQSLDAGKERVLFRRLDHAGPGPITVTYNEGDFTHRDYNGKDKIPLGTLNIDVLEKTDLYAAVTTAYKK